MKTARDDQNNNSFSIKNKSNSKNNPNRYDKLRSSTINHQFADSYDLTQSNAYNTITNKTSQISSQSQQLNQQEKINSLINKNDRLKIQIIKIQKVLKEVEDSTVKPKSQYGVKFPEIRSEVLDKQLQNAYKQINHYQYQIQKKKSQQYEGTFAQQIRKAQKSLEEKRILRAKLQRQIVLIQRQSKQFTVLLKDNRTKIDFQNLAKRLNNQAKMYETRLDQEDHKTRMFYENQRKKKEHALKMENQLREAGFLKSDIQALRSKFFDQDPRQTSRTVQKQVVQDRTPQAYKSLLSQIKLLRKVARDNERKILKFQDQKQEYQQKNDEVKSKLVDAEKEIDKITKQIQFLKNHIDPSKFKPKLNSMNSLQSESITSGNGNSFNQSDSSQKAFPNRDKAVLKHHFQSSQIGQVTKRSQKFNDRKLLGRKSAKIVQVEFYENRMKILGFQVWYLVGQQKVQGSMIMIKNQNQRRLQRKKYSLIKGDHFVAIECVVGQKNIITGLTLVSLMGTVAKAGNMDGIKRFIDLNPREYPCCIYACIGRDGIQLVGTQRVQPQKAQNSQV